MACLSEVFFLIFLQAFKVCCKEIGTSAINKFENQLVCIDVTKNTKMQTNTIYKNESPVLSWGRNNVILAESYENRINISFHSTNELTFCLINTSRDDAGSYYWKDSFGWKHALVVLTVWFGPTHLLLTPNANTTNILNESSVLEIICTANCNPDCNIYWKKDQDRSFSNSTTLLLENISKADRGNYTCIAENVQDNNHNISTKIELYVNYAANINLTKFGNEKENSTMKIACSVDSYPVSNISLFKDNRELVTSSYKENEVLLYFRNTTCDDTGTYECSAYNGFGTKGTQEIQLEILCKPRFIGKETGYAVVKNMKASIGDEIIHSFIVQAYPSPEVKLVLHDVNVTITRLSYTVFQVHLRKSISAMSDFRLYSVIIGNEKGIVTIVLHLEKNSSHHKDLAINFKHFIITTLSLVTFPVFLYLIYHVLKRKMHRKENLSLGNSEAIYVNTELEVTESISEITFDEAYVFQNRVREVELAATESYENLAATGGNTEYEEMDGKTDSEVNDSQTSDRNSIQQEGSGKEYNIKMDEDGYLLSIDVDAKKPSERLSTQSEKSKESNDVLEDAVPASK